ncbi:MAG: hypothetical protein ACM3IL_03105, partial [Deltaproteobacteria bacterium]
MTRTEMRLRTIKDFILREAQKKMDKATMDISEFTEESFRQRFEIVFRGVLRENRDILLNPDERKQIFDDLLSYFLGLGPIDALLKDEEITEIMINGPKNVYVERRG